VQHARRQALAQEVQSPELRMCSPLLHAIQSAVR
jgi:hypothetical protein